MPRLLKSYTELDPAKPEQAVPKSNRFTLDLAGLDLTEDELAKVRQEAVRAAMVSAASMLAPRFGGDVMNGFGTFSTFATFSTFSSGSAFEQLEERLQQGLTELPREARSTINKVVGPSTKR